MHLPPMTAGMKLDDLARRAGVSPRTVRYYVQRGLLPPPAFRGPDTAYSDEHLVRLRAIRALQDAYWPLDAIASALSARDLDEIRRIASGHLPASPASPTSPASPAPEPPKPVRARASHASALPTRRAARVALAPGLELLLDDDAPEESRALVDSIRALVTQKGTPS